MSNRRGRIRSTSPTAYTTLHMRLLQDMQWSCCDMCGDTVGPFINACVNPTRWVTVVGRLMLVGDDALDYRRMCRPCSYAHDQRVRNEALAAFFGVGLP
jgi:hypothetical protein